MIIEKAKVYSEIFLRYKVDGVETTELKERCKKYLENLDNFKRDYKFVLNENIDDGNVFNLGGRAIRVI